MRITRMLVVVAVTASLAGSVALATGASASSTRPQALSYYSDLTWIHPNSQVKQCLTATGASGGQRVVSLPCIGSATKNRSSLQVWDAVGAFKGIQISLAAYPNVVIAGVPGPKGQVMTVDTGGGTVPPDQIIGITGSQKFPNNVNGVKNFRKNYMSLPKKGVNVVWGTLTQRFVKGYTQAWIIVNGWTVTR